MATVIVPQLIRGRLYFRIADVLFPTFAPAAGAWSAAIAHRLDIVEVRHVNPELLELQAQRTAALATMRASARDLKAFAEAAKVEAELAFQIRRLKRAAVGVQAVRS